MDASSIVVILALGVLVFGVVLMRRGSRGADRDPGSDDADEKRFD